MKVTIFKDGDIYCRSGIKTFKGSFLENITLGAVVKGMNMRQTFLYLWKCFGVFAKRQAKKIRRKLWQKRK